VSARRLVRAAIALLVFAAPAGPSSRLTENIGRKVLRIPASQFQVV
jgi:hypothetical protein